MPLLKDKAWFPTRRYGYGWGFPTRWQGWLVFVIFIAAFLAGTPLISKGPAYFIAYVSIISAVMTAICWWKGEAARWRWGDDNESKKPDQTP